MTVSLRSEAIGMERKQLKDSIEKELHENLLPFWRERSLDEIHGGFVAEMDIDGTANREAPKGLVLNARLLWTFSALYRRLGDKRDLALARRAYEYLEDHFLDRDYKGYVWSVTPGGRVLDGSKKIYGQAFCIYALSEYHFAAGADDSLLKAKESFDLIEAHAHDETHGGYIEVRSRDWSPAEDLRLSDRDMDVAKSMNNHLHLLEGYTNLYRIRPDEAVSERLRELIGLFGKRMLTPAGHFNLFFDGDWKERSDSYSYGHDIEAAWLLCEAAEALNHAQLREQVSQWAVETASAVGAEALDVEGGLAYAGRKGAVIDSNREWWPQAEAILGFWHAYRISGEEKFASIAGYLWEFVQSRMVDREGGEWFWRVFSDGTVDRKEPKISEWKDPYHGVRMCLKMLQFLGD